MNILAKNLWERKYLDLWTIVHFTTGMCFAFAIFFYGSPFLASFIVFTFFSIVWEVAEYYHGALEPFTNQCTDVLSGVAGFLIVAQYVPTFAPLLRDQILYFTVFFVVAWTFAHFGFKSLALHFNKDKKQYDKSLSRAAVLYVVIMAAIAVF